MAELENEQRKRESFIGGDERKEAAMTDAGKMGGKVRTKKKKRKKKFTSSWMLFGIRVTVQKAMHTCQ